MRIRTVAAVALAAALACTMAGCAEPVRQNVVPNQAYWSKARQEIRTADLTPPRGWISDDRLIPAVDRVLPQVREAAYAICVETWGAVYGCQLMRTAPVYVFPQMEINAFADLNNQIGVYAGLIRETGSDAEIAAVLAHEFTHVMLGHGASARYNATLGNLLGAFVGGAWAGATGADAQQMGKLFGQSGAFVGGRVYSRDMEIEADHMSVYILRRAGFPPTAMRDVVVRLSRLNPARGGFLATHPSDDRRLAHVLKSISRAERNIPWWH